MIYVSVGTNKKDFSRLVKYLDVPNIKYNFYFQIGFTKYIPVNHDYFKFKESSEIEKIISDSKFVISHGGFGILSEVIRLKKNVIIIPRLFENGEADNDQTELGSYLSSLYPKSIMFIRDVNDIFSSIEKIAAVSQPPEYFFQSEIPQLINSFVSNNEKY